MSLTILNVEIANPAKQDLTETVGFLIDSGALFSVVSEETLRKLGMRPTSEEEFTLADGSTINRKMGFVMFKYKGRTRVGDVIFGEPSDSELLGVITLEAFGFMLDPIRRELIPMPFGIGYHKPPRRR